MSGIIKKVSGTFAGRRRGLRGAVLAAILSLSAGATRVPAQVTDVVPPPPYLGGQRGSSFLDAPLPANQLGLTNEERRLAAAFLNGAFESDDAKVRAFNNAVSQIKDMSGGQIFDFLNYRLRTFTQPGGPVDGPGDAVADVLRKNPDLAQGLLTLLKRASGADAPTTPAQFKVWFEAIVTGRALDDLAPEIKVDFINTLEPYFKQAIGQIESLGTILAHSDQIKIEPKIYDTIFKMLFQEYYSQLPLANKKVMLRELLELPTDASLARGLSVIFNNSGPIMQKLLQMIGREPSLAPDFAALLRSLESGVKPVEFEQIHRVMAETAPEVYPQLFRSFERKPIGTGTVAQAHRAVMALPEKGDSLVAVRVLKPGIEEAMDFEAKIFKSFGRKVEALPEVKGTEFANFGTVLESLENTVREELDVVRSGKNQLEARRLLSKSVSTSKLGKKVQIDITVPDVYLLEKSGTRMLVMEFFNGVSMSKFFEFDPEGRRVVAEIIVEQWMNEALFGTGFFHTDLHQGNVMVARATDGDIKVALLDFGMVSRISPEQRGAFMKLGAAIAFNDKAMARSTLNLLLKTPLPSETLDRIVDEVFAGASPSAHDLVRKVAQAGGEVPDAFIGFSRGLFLADQLLRWSGSDRKPEEVITSLAVRAINKDLPRRMLDVIAGGHKSKLPLSNAELARIARNAIWASCKSTISSFLHARPRIVLGSP